MSTLMGQARRVPRIAEAAVERARLTVVPRNRQRAPRVPFFGLVAVLLVGGVVGLLLFNTSMQQASFTATAMETQASVLQARQQSLQMELEALRDPQRVAERAKALGMVPSPAPAFLRLSDGAVLGRPVVAAPDGGMQISPLPTQKPKNLRPDPVIVEAPAPKHADKRDKAESDRDTAVPSSEPGDAAGTKKTSHRADHHGSTR